MIKHSQLFRREGDYWTIAFDGRVVRLRDGKGVRYLSVLLHRPGESLPAHTVRVLADAARASGETAETAAPDESARAAERARVTVTKAIRSVLTKLSVDHPTLAEHLAATVHRGHRCIYRPDPRVAVRWHE